MGLLGFMVVLKEMARSEPSMTVCIAQSGSRMTLVKPIGCTDPGSLLWKLIPCFQAGNGKDNPDQVYFFNSPRTIENGPSLDLLIRYYSKNNFKIEI
jgi:hypothetical protein